MTSKKTAMKDWYKQLDAKFNNDRIFSITIAPANKRQFIDAGLNRFTKCRDYLIKVLERRKFGQYLKLLELYPDVSRNEILGVNRVHWHGWLQFDNVRAFTLNQYEIENYRIEIDTTDANINEYFKYCKKWIDKYPDDEMYKIDLSHINIVVPPDINISKRNIISDLKKRDLKNKHKLMQIEEITEIISDDSDEKMA